VNERKWYSTFVEESKKYVGGFRKLIVWREAHALTLKIYKITQNFPKHEIYGVTSQLRRASSSIGANIAEGSAKQSLREQAVYYNRSLSSCTEVDNFLELVHDLAYISDEQYEDLLSHVNKVAYLITQLCKSVKQRLKTPAS